MMDYACMCFGFSVLIGYVASGDPYKWKGYYLALAIFLWNLIHQSNFVNMDKYCFKMRMRVRTALVSAIYRKVNMNY